MTVNYAFNTLDLGSNLILYLKPEEVNIGDGESADISIQDAARTVVQLTKLTAEIQLPGLSLAQATALETKRSNDLEQLVAGTAVATPLDLGSLQLLGYLVGLGRSYPSLLNGQAYFQQPMSSRFMTTTYQ